MSKVKKLAWKVVYIVSCQRTMRTFLLKKHLYAARRARFSKLERKIMRGISKYVLMIAAGLFLRNLTFHGRMA